ncbi:phosphopeptide-binding protein [bacterium]|nr:phosphopeptide-binding protein [bacterium]
MNKSLFKVGMIASALFLSACGENTPKEPNDEMTETKTEEAVKEETAATEGRMTQDGITIYPADIAQDFPDAKLTLNNPKDDAQLKVGENQFDFTVSDYELAVQTDDAMNRHCANSEKGQHIHFILNNAPYLAKYEPSFKAELGEGNNVVLSFLSRSYHESIKNSTAFVLKNFPIGKVENTFDEKAPHLFYSRPKGEYSGKDAEKILLDFYLLNTELSTEGNRVQVEINGTSFLIDQWQPYFVEGLKEGENTFRIKLISADGAPVEGPFNDSGDRIITIKK